MDLKTALSALKSASTLEAASAARLVCLAAPDLEEAADWVEHKYAQRVKALEALARHDALEAEGAKMMAHKRERVAALESEPPTVARDIRIRILRAELAVDEASRMVNAAMDLALKSGDWTTALAREGVARDTVLELRRAEWARRCYRLKTGGHGPLGGGRIGALEILEPLPLGLATATTSHPIGSSRQLDRAEVWREPSRSCLVPHSRSLVQSVRV